MKKLSFFFLTFTLSFYLLQAQTNLIPLDGYGDGSLLHTGQRHYVYYLDSFSLIYNSQELLTETNRLDSSSLLWELKWKISNEYNGANQLTAENNLSVPITINSIRKEFVYNTSDLLDTEIKKEWDDNLNGWQTTDRKRNTYTTFNEISISLSESYSIVNNTWSNENRLLYTYSNTQSDSVRENQIWSTNQNQWLPLQRRYRFRDAQGLLSTELYTNYNSNADTFYNYLKNDYTYNTSQQLATDKYLTWNFQAGYWENVSLKTYAYNSQGLLENELIELWDETTLTWEIDKLTTYTYNTSGQLTVILYQERDGSSWVNKKRETFTRNAQGYCTAYLDERFYNNTWNVFSKYNNWFTPKQITGIKQKTENNRLFVYPNPSSGNVIFVQSKAYVAYQIYDASGRMVQSGNLQQGTNSIILSANQGMYFLKAGNITTKILVK